MKIFYCLAARHFWGLVLFLHFYILFGSGHISAQSFPQLSRYGIQAETEIGAVVATDASTPFWLRTNQYGIVPKHAPSGILQGRIWRPYAVADSLGAKAKKFDWGFAINPVATLARQDLGKIILPEAHFKIRFGNVEFWGGRKKETIGLGDSTLSSGFWATSGNAMPIPKIQLATIGFAPLKFTKGFVAINAAFSHGWFNVPYIQGARLHQKYLYIRLGKPKHMINFYAGLNHQVQWAGHSEALKAYPDLALNGELPSSWKFYPNVVFAYTSKDWYNKPGYISYDSYRLGNHLGSYDVAVEAKFADKKILVYHQHPYEDVSGILFVNFPDGLWGVNYSLNADKYKPWGLTITKLTAEFLTTLNQSGATFYVPGSKYQGSDNYYNHGQYMQGWTYSGHTIGTPFIAPKTDLIVPSAASSLYLPDTRVNMWYLGAQLLYRETTSITVRASYSKNYGAAGIAGYPTPIGQFSGLIAAQVPMPQWFNTYITAKLAVDSKGIFSQGIGGYIGIRKSW